MLPNINPKSIRPAPSWAEPSAEDFKALQDYAGWSGPDIARMLNLKINPKNGAVSSVQKWRTHGGTPFTVWALLCIESGIATLDNFGFQGSRV